MTGNLLLQLWGALALAGIGAMQWGASRSSAGRADTHVRTLGRTGRHMDRRILHLIATVVDCCGGAHRHHRGRPPTETVRVVAALRRLLREGTPWRSLTANEDQASSSTLRRYLAFWAEIGLLARVHALLVGMLRGHPDLILDTCAVRAKRGGDLTDPNPTDRAKRGTKYHVAVDGDGVPVACLTTAANVNDTLAFERLFLAAFAVMTHIRTVFADSQLTGRPPCPRGRASEGWSYSREMSLFV